MIEMVNKWAKNGLKWFLVMIAATLHWVWLQFFLAAALMSCLATNGWFLI